MRFAFAIPGDLALPTGGYAYDRRVMAECRAAGCVVDRLQLAMDFPNPSAESLAAAQTSFASVPANIPILVDGLAFGALPAELLRRAGRRFIALVHHPLALETGLPEGERVRLRLAEREALAEAIAVIATSPSTARALVADYDVPAGRITVALPGTDPASRAAGGNTPPMVLAVGALVPRKGYPVLIEALGLLAALDWRCQILGAIDRNPSETARIKAEIARHGLTPRVEIAGQVDDETLAAAYAAADLLVMPSFHEGYGMALSEALARGLPIVATTAGAIPETVPAEASTLVPPGDARALAAALGTLLAEPETWRSKAEAAWGAGQKLPRWRDTAAAIIAAIETSRGG